MMRTIDWKTMAGRWAIVAGLLAACNLRVNAQMATWTFDNLSAGQLTNSAALTNVIPDIGSGLTATFTSSPAFAFSVDPSGNNYNNALSVSPPSVPTIAGNFLHSTAPSAALTITFNRPIAAFFVDFEQSLPGVVRYTDNSGFPIDFDAFTYAPANAALGQLFGGESGVSNAADTVTFVTLTPTVRGTLGVDRIRVFFSPAAVPEPGTTALFAGLSIFGAGLFVRRRGNARPKSSTIA